VLTERQARHHTLAVDQHRAGAAGALVAALLRAGQAQVVTQGVQQGDAGVEPQRVGGAVDLEGDLHLWNFGCFRVVWMVFASGCVHSASIPSF
jgi:hypothetical protein